MYIDIYDVRGRCVSFTSKYGKACGIWKESVPPSIGKYDIEIDSEYKIKPEDVHLTSKRDFGLNYINEKIEILAYMSI